MSGDYGDATAPSYKQHMTKIDSTNAARLTVATVAIGSFLLFMVEPMVARLALPRLGGSPAVWNSAVLVYQTLLLMGYLWAHVTSSLAPRNQAIAHISLLAVAGIWLPIGLAAGAPPADVDPTLWTPILIAGSIGPLFLALAAQSTLLQRWQATRGGNPYPLYAASNAGSMLGLLMYPFVIEPLSTLETQRIAWSIGYVGLAILMVICATTLPRRGEGEASPKSKSPGIVTYARWILLAAIPSGLMLSTTTVITTDLAAGPMLWVLPLAVYLASYIAAFSGRDGLIASSMRVAPILLLVSGGLAMSPLVSIPAVALIIGLATLYAASVAIHGRLYRERPPVDRLTGFYLALAFGGVIGGAFSALFAPIVFNWTWEHLILLAAASLAFKHRPLIETTLPAVRIGIPVAALAIGLCAIGWIFGHAGALISSMVIILLGIVSVMIIGRRDVFIVCLLSLFVIQSAATVHAKTGVDIRQRSYFGMTRVLDIGDARIMFHGTTAHGEQRMRPNISTEPLGYYSSTSGVGRALSIAPLLYGDNARIDIVGLGTGTLACWSQPGQSWRFHEIDPDIVRIARDSGLFQYIPRCQPDAEMIIGDARVNLAAQAADSADIVVLDAFSSDAIPTHLMTKQAFAAYDRVTGNSGLVIAHISNRHLNLEPVLAAMKDRHAIVLTDDRPKAGDPMIRASTWVALSRDRGIIETIRQTDKRWRALKERKGYQGWTDDHASILPVLIL